MPKKIPEIMQRFTFFLLSLGWIVPNGFAQVDMLSPKLSISSPLLQNATQNLINQEEIHKAQNSLPEWVNVEGLGNIKDLKITKKVTKNQISTIDNEEEEIFDNVSFELDFIAEDGLPQTGKILIWEYKRPSGAKIFLNKSNRYNLRVVTFTPGLPRGKARRDYGELEKAGVGISLLWLLFAQEPRWHNKEAVIFNAETPSQRVFKNLAFQWSNIIFSAVPYYSKGINLPRLEHVAFTTPELTQTQMIAVKDFFENKITFVDERSDPIVIPNLAQSSTMTINDNLRPDLSPPPGFIQKVVDRTLVESKKNKKAAGQDELPYWLNFAELANIKDLKIERRTVNENRFLEGKEPEYEVIDFNVSYKDNQGMLHSDGLIRVWESKNDQGVKLFQDYDRRFNVVISTFKPELPRGLKDEENKKAGVGITLLWLLLAQEPQLQNKEAVIIHAEEPSQKVFNNLKDQWMPFMFDAAPLSQGTKGKLPIVSNISFKTPNLTQEQALQIKEFFANNIEFVNNAAASVSIVPLPSNNFLQNLRKNFNLIQQAI